MIATLGLRYTLPGAGARLIDDVTMDVLPGRVAALTGPNGAGKTTLLRLLAGLLPPTAGIASVAGYDVARFPLEVRALTGVMTQSPGVPEGSTPAWHLRLHGALRLDGRDKGDPMAVLMRCLGLEGVARRGAGSLSPGYLRRIALARALLHDPPVLLLDEPTSGLDARSVETLKGIVRALAGRGRTILIATHDGAFMRDHCDTVFRMDDGRILSREP